MEQVDIRRLKHFVDAKRPDEALEFTEQLVTKSPDDLLARANYGASLRSAGRSGDAMAHFESVLANARPGVDDQALFLAHLNLAGSCELEKDWPGVARHYEEMAKCQELTSIQISKLSSAYYQLEDWEQARKWGRRAIELRDREGRCSPSEAIARARPKPFDPSAKSRNIISMSLYGEDSFYRESAVTVARMMPAIFPEFTCRFYCGEDVPTMVLRALKASGSQVIIVKAEGGKPQPKNWGLFWRFLAFDDADVDVVFMRDVDRPPLPRERAAIDLWLKSNAPFYAMRDSVLHSEPLMAGMWGGFTGLLPKLQPHIAKYVSAEANRFADQDFLRLMVWPRIRDAVFSIDSNYAIGVSVDFPGFAPMIGNVQIGRNWPKARMLDSLTPFAAE